MATPSEQSQGDVVTVGEPGTEAEEAAAAKDTRLLESTAVSKVAANTADSKTAKEPASNGRASGSHEGAWPQIPDTHPLAQFLSILDDVLKDADYDEIYSLHLKGATEAQRKIILQKYLRANANDLEKARTQLLETLKWRKVFQPLKAKDEIFTRQRFDGLGYVTNVEKVPATWNIYGSVKHAATTFEDLDGFMRWRVGMMELTLARLDLANAAAPVPDYGNGTDPYQCLQIHDYLGVSFLRQDPHTKAAAKKAVEVFQKYYPETLSRKFFVNVPVIMGWMFSAMRLILSKETVRKFTVITYGKDLVGELGSDIPKAYGGDKPDLDVQGEQLNFDK